MPSVPFLSVLTIPFAASSPKCLAWGKSKLGALVTARPELEGRGRAGRLSGLELTCLGGACCFGKSWGAVAVARMRNYPQRLLSD